MGKIILTVPAIQWLLMFIGFGVHLLMKVGKASRNKKTFLTTATKISIPASLLMSIGIVIAMNYQFKDLAALPFMALGAGYLNNSLWTNIMQMSNFNKVGKNE